MTARETAAWIAQHLSTVQIERAIKSGKIGFVGTVLGMRSRDFTELVRQMHTDAKVAAWQAREQAARPPGR